MEEVEPREEPCPFKPQLDRLDVLAWYIWGRVLDVEDKLMPGARVELSIEYGHFHDRHDLEPVMTDSRGIYKISAPLPFPVHRYSMTGSFYETITGIAYAEGYYPYEESFCHTYTLSETQEDVRIDFFFYSESKLYGRVVDELGAPIKNAEVVMTFADTDANYIPTGQYETYVDLVLKEVTKGRLILQIEDSSRNPIDDDADIKLKLDSDKVNICCKTGDLERVSPGHYSIEFPPCLYTLEILPKGYKNYMPPRICPVPHMLKSRKIENNEIRADGEAFIKAVLPIGGRLSLTLCEESETDHNKKDSESEPERPLVFDFQNSYTRFGRRYPGYPIDLTGIGDGGCTRLSSFRSKDGMRYDRDGDLEAGVPFVSNRIFDPGEYILCIAPKGYAPVKKRISIKVDRITDVMIEFERH